MIDTLVLTTTGSVEQDSLINLWDPPITHHHDHDDVRTYNTYRYRRNDLSPQIRYTAESHKVTVSIPSLPKFVLGTSAVAIDDHTVPLALDRVYQYAVEAGIRDLPNIETWDVSKSDPFCDFQVGRDVSNYVRAFSNIVIPNYTTVTYGNQTVAWRSRCGHREIRCYDRYSKCVDTEEDAATTAMSQGIIRLEVQTSGTDFRKETGRSNIGSVFRSDVILPMLRRYMERLHLDNLRITTLSDIRRSLTVAYGPDKASIIVNYLQDQAHGVNLPLHRSTIWRHKRDLRALGIAPVIGIRRLPSLQITTIPNTEARLAEAEVYRLMALGG